MRDYDWSDIVEQLGGSSLDISGAGDRISFYKHPFGRCVVHENGGEVNVDFGSAPGLPGEVVALVPGHTPALHRRVCIASFRLPFSIAYWSSASSAGHIDETTFAYRLRQALNGLPIDYSWGADLELCPSCRHGRRPPPPADHQCARCPECQQEI